MEIPSPVDLTEGDHFLGKHPRSSTSSSSDEENDDDEEEDEFAPPKKKRRIDVNSIEVDPQYYKSKEYKPHNEDSGRVEDYESFYHVENPRRSKREIKQRKKYETDEIVTEETKRLQKRKNLEGEGQEEKNSNKMLFKLLNNEELEVMKSRKTIEKGEFENVAFEVKGIYETGVLKIESGKSFKLVSNEKFDVIFYCASGYCDFKMRENQGFMARPGVCVRIPAGNEIEILNDKNSLARLFYTKIYKNNNN